MNARSWTTLSANSGVKFVLSHGTLCSARMAMLKLYCDVHTTAHLSSELHRGIQQTMSEYILKSYKTSAAAKAATSGRLSV